MTQALALNATSSIDTDKHTQQHMGMSIHCGQEEGVSDQTCLSLSISPGFTETEASVTSSK